MANPVKDIVQRMGLALKAASVVFSDGRVLPGRGYSGDFRSFFSELVYGPSDAGVRVTSETALNYTAYWACVRLISKSIASLPCILYERMERGKKRAVNHPLYRLLHDEPNPDMDAYTYIETLIYHLIANNGNAYSFIEWDPSRTEIRALWPMDPSRVTKGRDPETREIRYLYQSDNGPVEIPAYRVWHIPGFGYDGLVGYTPLTYARNQIGLAIAAERMGAHLFKNGLTLGGVVTHPGVMSTQAQDNFRAMLAGRHQGVDKAHEILVLEEGMKYDKNSLPPEDAQMLETRKFQRNEIATFFGVPPHKIGDLERATFNNIEEQNLEYVIDCIRPIVIRIEKSANRQLLLPDEKAGFFTEYLLEGLLRGDSSARASFYKELYYLGALSPNDIREKENMNPITDADGNEIPEGYEYFTQQNMIALSLMGNSGSNNNQNQQPPAWQQ